MWEWGRDAREKERQKTREREEEAAPHVVLLFSLDANASSHASAYSHAPSQADVAVFETVKSPNADKFPHVARWYTHIASWEAEHPNLQGDKKQAANLLG